MRTPGFRKWAAEEDAILKATWPASDVDIQRALRARGYWRSLDGVERRRQRFFLRCEARRVAPDPDPWPSPWSEDVQEATRELGRRSLVELLSEHRRLAA